MSRSRDEKDWAEEWERQEARLEEELEAVFARLTALEGIKKRLMYKSVINYVRGLLNE